MKKSFQDVLAEYGVPFGPPDQLQPLKPLLPQRIIPAPIPAPDPLIKVLKIYGVYDRWSGKNSSTD